MTMMKPNGFAMSCPGFGKITDVSIKTFEFLGHWLAVSCEFLGMLETKELELRTNKLSNFELEETPSKCWNIIGLGLWDCGTVQTD